MTLTVQIVCDNDRCVGSTSHNVIDARPIWPLREMRSAEKRGWTHDGVRDLCPSCSR